MQVTDGHGLDVQRERIRAWAAYQGLTLDAVEEDAGVSGATTDNRPGFRRAMRVVLSTGAGATLVVYKLDRLGRNALDVQEVLAVLLDAGVRVVSIADGVDSASGMGAAMLKLLTSILATFAELEKETITTRLQDGRQRARASLRVYSSEPRLGFGADGKVIAPNEDEQRAIARARELYADGHTIRAIAAALTAEGFQPRHGARWSTSVVHHLVTGERKPAPKKKTKRIERARAELLSVEGTS